MKLTDYRVWVFDLDGTLYRQMPVRLEMAAKLLTYYFLRPWRLRELFLLKEFRAEREKLLSDEENLARLQSKYGLEPKKIIREWLFDRALESVRRWKREKVLSAIEAHRRAGGVVIVYSDYPVEEKLSAMGLTVDFGYWSGAPSIDCLKPDPRGLNNVITRLNLDRAEILYVGDRDDRDGECARRAGVSYLDIKEFERRLDDESR